MTDGAGTDVKTELQKAMALHQQGAFAEAERHYRRALELAPESFDALQLLGALAIQTRRHEEGVALIRKALEVHPGTFGTHLNLGSGLRDLGRHAEAVASFDAALALKPDYAEAHNMRGISLHELDRADEALAAFDRAIALKPDFAEAHNNRGIALRHMDRGDEALEAYDRAIAANPNYPDAHNNRGIVLRDREETEAALAAFDRAIALKPDFAEAHNNRGNALQAAERPVEALASYDRAIALNPHYAEAHNNRGSVLNDLERPEEALESFDRAISLKRDYPEAWSNRGYALQQLKRAEAALASYDRAIALRDDDASALNNRGNALQELERPEDALDSFDRAIALKPEDPAAYSNRGNALKDLMRLDDALASYSTAARLREKDEGEETADAPGAEAHARPVDPEMARYQAAKAAKSRHENAEADWNRSLCLLLMGRLEEGWREYESRKARKESIAGRQFVQPEWTGAEDLTGRTLFLHWEQGLGDTIQFCRYAKLAKARGAKVVLSVQKPLGPLMRGLDPEIEILVDTEAPARFDVHAPLMSMPLAFGTVSETIPADIPYLQAEPDRVAAWRDRLGGEGFRIGICWQGSKSKIDIGRSFPVRNFAGIAALDGIRLISLQKGVGTEQLADLPAGMTVEDLGEDFDAGSGAFLDTAAVMQSLDLVITSDTSIAHLAGALGRPVWIALKQVPDWRWLLAGSTSRWYPTARLFRQPRRTDWAPVFAEMEAELRRQLA